METILNLGIDVVQQVIDAMDFFIKWSLDGFLGESSFRSGFFAALGWVGIVGIIGFGAKGLLVLWDRILQFFQPTKEPSNPPSKEGPSPLKYTVRMLTGVAALAFLAFLLFQIVVAPP